MTEKKTEVFNETVVKEEKKIKFIIRPKIKDDWTIKDIGLKYASVIYPSWANVFSESADELEDIDTVLSKKGDYYPLKQNIFAAFVTPLHKVRIIIIGQDPYHQTLSDGTPRAQGLSFSVRKDDDIPVSLKNIYKEIASSVKNFVTPSHGDLHAWAQQGVLLLNSCLTVKPGEADSHSKNNFWLGFVSRVLAEVQKVRPDVIVVMWGSKAQKIGKLLGSKAIKLTAPHPSGFSAYRGFFGCGHFVKINQYLKEKGEEEINWNIE
jgi:uracil-DNA glycosylase